MGAKAFDRVKQTFFAPERWEPWRQRHHRARMLEAMAGFGPQMIMEGGEKTMIGGAPGTLGPIVSHVESEVCMTVLPGTGFIPAPDIVVQTRARKPDEMMQGLQAAARKLNEQFVERDLPPPWREATVWDKPMLWSEGASYPGAMLPFIMRPVLFVTEEKDAKDRERSFLVIAWTTTSPGFVERWRRLPRNDSAVPATRRTGADVDQLAGVRRLILTPTCFGRPPARAAPAVLDDKAQLTDVVTATSATAGLTLSHAGPLPVGRWSSVMGTVAAAPDEFGGSDWRERLAAASRSALSPL
jgi:hypothetical protein